MYADIKLGYTCNNNCIHCVIADQREHALKLRGNTDRTTEEYKSELIDSLHRGVTEVTFTGGEPTIRKDIIDLIMFAEELGMRVNMQTNGRMFSYADFAEKISKYGVHFVVALHSHTPEGHDAITRAKGSFQQTVQGIKNLTALKQDVLGKVVISKKNCQNLKNIAMLFHELKVGRINLAFPHGQGNAYKNFQDVVPRYSDIYEYVHEAIDYCKQKNIKIKVEAMPYCFMQGYEEHVGENDLKKKGYSELKQLDNTVKNWTKVRLEIKTKFPQCKTCINDAVCEGPWEEYPRIYGSEEFVPVTEQNKNIP